MADADPASDVLYGTDVFLSYRLPVLDPVRKPLDDLTAQAKRGGFPIKVAVIAQSQDLGGVPLLFGRPQAYAAFLGRELSLGYKGTLVVAMPAGYGVHGPGDTPSARRALRGLDSPADAADLARAAQTAVVRVAAGAGHPLALHRGAGGGLDSAALAAIALSAAAAAGAGAFLWRRLHAS